MGGLLLFAAPIAVSPPASRICGSRSDRLRRMASQEKVAWCTLLVLSATLLADAVTRAVAATQAFRAVVETTAESVAPVNSPSPAPVFRLSRFLRLE